MTFGKKHEIEWTEEENGLKDVKTSVFDGKDVHLTFFGWHPSAKNDTHTGDECRLNCVKKGHLLGENDTFSES